MDQVEKDLPDTQKVDELVEQCSEVGFYYEYSLYKPC